MYVPGTVPTGAIVDRVNAWERLSVPVYETAEVTKSSECATMIVPGKVPTGGIVDIGIGAVIGDVPV